jgi:hypothetical protein
MLLDAVHFFLSLVEVIVAVALILITGLIVARIAFWILSRILGKLADSYEDEMDDFIAIPTPPEDISIATRDEH